MTRPARPNFARGMTLIEVVAGLALLGTLLVGIVLAKVRYTHQWTAAERRVQAVGAADDLLSAWWADAGSFPRRDAGEVPGRPGLAWRTAPVSNPAVEALDARAVRLEVFDRAAPTDPPVVVDVVLPPPPPVPEVGR